MAFEMVKGRMRKVIAKILEESLKGKLECRWQISSKTIAPLDSSLSSVRR